jgi:predicted nucleic acid-binding protein
MSTDKIVFDTNILLGFLKQYAGYPDLRVLFPDSDLFVSEITEFELLSFWNITPTEEASVEKLMQDLVIVPFLPEIKRQAVIFRRTTKTRTPDAGQFGTAELPRVFCISKNPYLNLHGVSAMLKLQRNSAKRNCAAIALDATLVTNDEKLRKAVFPGLTVLADV